jgi:hypothetical protein
MHVHVRGCSIPSGRELDIDRDRAREREVKRSNVNRDCLRFYCV